MYFLFMLESGAHVFFVLVFSGNRCTEVYNELRLLVREYKKFVGRSTLVRQPSIKSLLSVCPSVRPSVYNFLKTVSLVLPMMTADHNI